MHIMAQIAQINKLAKVVQKLCNAKSQFSGGTVQKIITQKQIQQNTDLIGEKDDAVSIINQLP